MSHTSAGAGVSQGQCPFMLRSWQLGPARVHVKGCRAIASIRQVMSALRDTLADMHMPCQACQEAAERLRPEPSRYVGR